jgi:predicted aspartyl protease
MAKNSFSTMLKLSPSSAAILGLVGAIGLGSLACTQLPFAQSPTASPTPVANQPTPKASPKSTKPVAAKTTAKKTATKPKPSENYQLALDKADSAGSISQSAQSPEDWNLVVSRWEEAVNLLKKLPANDPNKKLANQKLADFQASLSTARDRAARSGKTPVATLKPLIVVDPVASADAPEVAMAANQAPIKYRDSRIPVIEVVFNNSQSFDMMVDTGASGTMITPDMADALGVQPIGSATAMTPAGPTNVEIGVIKSMRVGNRIVRNVQVAIGPVRLLGHDFFGNCDITIRQNVVEFGQCG